MKIFFLFLDGVGLGDEDELSNPFFFTHMPTLMNLLGGKPLTRASVPFEGPRAALYNLDACLGVAGLPQSATGQAVLLTGRNVPQELGYHYGPKPDAATAAFLEGGGIFADVLGMGKRGSFLNAYPAAYFHGVDSGKRLYSSIPLAVVNAGLPLLTGADLAGGQAVSADFTGKGWVERKFHPGIQIISPQEAGRNIARLAAQYDFSFLEYWLTDYAGHKQDRAQAAEILLEIDQVLAGFVDEMSADQLVLITSDHGNMEDLSTRRHTFNEVPLILIGNPALRTAFAGAKTLADIHPAILKSLS